MRTRERDRDRKRSLVNTEQGPAADAAGPCLSKSTDLKIGIEELREIEWGDSVKGGRSPRFRVVSSARRRKISDMGRNRP